MKGRVWRWLLGLVFVGVLRATGTVTAEPAEVFSFGTANLQVPLTNVFTLRNTGPEAFSVVSVRPSCECLEVLAHPAAIGAGGTGNVEVRYVPDKVGQVDYRVLVKTTSPTTPMVEYAVQGVVTAAPLMRMDRDWPLYVWTEEAKKIARDPASALWVDVRNEAAHRQCRIPGSLQIPLHAVKTKGFLKGRRVIVLDAGDGSRAVEDECRRLRERGFSNLAIWYGGMNAWHRLGGAVEGDDCRECNTVPAPALHDIAYSTDWLMVAVNSAVPDDLNDAMAMTINASNQTEFVATLNAAIGSRAQVASVLLMAARDEEYATIAGWADEIGAHVFFLEGGLAAWSVHSKMMAGMQNQRVLVARSTGTVGGAVVRPAGCGGCPK